jgi:hypothetical protein
VFPNQGRCHHVKLLKRNHAIHFQLAANESREVDHERRTGIVGHCDQIVQTVAWPVFLKHFFLGDQNDIATEAFAFANKVATFEIGGEADDVKWASSGFGHCFLVTNE